MVAHQKLRSGSRFNEIKEILLTMGLNLGMRLDQPAATPAQPE